MTTDGPGPDDALSRHVWEARYRAAGETRLAHTWQRVAHAVAAAEPDDRDYWETAFYRLLEDFVFLPGGRILAGAGTDRRVTLFNCFVMGVVEDSMNGIFDALKEGALSMQQGGGVGYDFSTLRPSGLTARSGGAIASGPVSFMGIWDAMCATLLSTGARRGAMMATLRCDHPDIEAFIEVKRDPALLRHFNLSVQVTDDFMAAVGSDSEWPLVFPADRGGSGEGAVLRRRWTGTGAPVDCRVHRTVRARSLWERLMRAAYDVAEPGVLFVDTINRDNTLHDCEHLTATNPCGEIPLPPYGACDLGSLNLARFVLAPFEAGAHVDEDALAAATRHAVRFLDNVIAISRFPLEAQAQEAEAKRRIGLGVTGLADALAMMGLEYDSAQGRDTAAAMLAVVRDAALAASIDLAAEKGAYPAFQADAWLASGYASRLSPALRDRIAREGLRNSHRLAIAPAGTISLLAGNVSSGIEPIFSLEADRRVLDENGIHRAYKVKDHAWAEWQRRRPGLPAGPAFVTARAMGPEAHLLMQAALQPYVDNGISKTINVDEKLPFAAFVDLYRQAHSLGLKGCTVFRPNPVTGAILSVPEAVATAPAPVQCCDPEREAD